MKKIVIILVLLVYSAATIGATVHLHYCMDKFAGWDLCHSEQDNKCVKCGMTEKKGGCCKDEHKQLKLKDDHQKSKGANAIQLIAMPALVTPITSFTASTIGAPYYIPSCNAPPPIPGERRYILHCVFRV